MSDPFRTPDYAGSDGDDVDDEELGEEDIDETCCPDDEDADETRES
jgi:hypothetical protein